VAAGAPAAIADRVARLHALAGAPALAALATNLGADEAATARAYTRLGEALGLDWARGAAAALTPADGWERLVAAGLAREFEEDRLALIRRVGGNGSPPDAAIEGWLGEHADAADSLARRIVAARASGPPTVAMLTHLAGLARATMAG
jgi:glutamate dehydrogenase